MYSKAPHDLQSSFLQNLQSLFKVLSSICALQGAGVRDWHFVTETSDVSHVVHVSLFLAVQEAGRAKLALC